MSGKKNKQKENKKDASAQDRLRASRSARFEKFEERLALTAQGLNDLVQPEVEELAVEQHGRFQATLDAAHEQTGVNYAHEEFGFQGKGQTVAIIDSGIAWDHYALGNGFGENHRVVGGYDFAEGDSNPYDDGPRGYHGTHVAGIVGSTDSTHTGVAPGADLVGLRVFNDQGHSELAWVEEALQWVHEHKDDFEHSITTVNLSLGLEWNSDNTPNWATLEDEFAQLEENGIFISVSAGNSFSKYNAKGVSYPAASKFVTPIASVDADGKLSDFSQRNDRVLAAPGEKIVSTVPSSLYGMTGASRFVGASTGTSMAAPYAAGASVLLREAMEFSGEQNIDQDAIYDHLRDTADQVYDSATGTYYARLNLGAALDALLPDDYGSSITDASTWSSFEDGAKLDGRIERLSDADYFTFTASATGTASFQLDIDNDFDIDWVSQHGTIKNGVLTIDVSAGQSYTFGLAGQGDGLSHYSITASMDAVVAPVVDPVVDPVSDPVIDPIVNEPVVVDPIIVDPVAPVVADPVAKEVVWGKVESVAFANQQVNGETHYDLTTAHNGILTLEAMYDANGNELRMELYNAAGERVAIGELNDSGQRIDFNVVAGEQYTLRVSGEQDNLGLRVTNLVEINNDQILVRGTDGSDAFAFVAGDSHLVSVNGVEYAFAAEQVTGIRFEGGKGDDRISVTGSAQREQAILAKEQLTFNSATYRLTAADVQHVVVDGGGGYDFATFKDSVGDDLFVTSAKRSAMSGRGFSNEARGFEMIKAEASAGGNDTLGFYDAAITSFEGERSFSYNGSIGTSFQFEFVQGAGEVAKGKPAEIVSAKSDHEAFVATPESSAPISTPSIPTEIVVGEDVNRELSESVRQVVQVRVETGLRGLQTPDFSTAVDIGQMEATPFSLESVGIAESSNFTFASYDAHIPSFVTAAQLSVSAFSNTHFGPTVASALNDLQHAGATESRFETGTENARGQETESNSPHDALFGDESLLDDALDNDLAEVVNRFSLEEGAQAVDNIFSDFGMLDDTTAS